MRQFLKILIPIAVTIFFTQPTFGYGPKGYEPSKHQKNHDGKSRGGKGRHGYGRPKGPPADIPAHIKERMSPDGKGINLNGSQIGVTGCLLYTSPSPRDS